MERLQKLIAQAGITSRRKAEDMIQAGRVVVNGKVITQLGFQADINDEIIVDGTPLKKEEKVYYLLNKPKHCLSTVTDDRGRETVIDYLTGVKERVFPVGRLDYDTTGVLLLTNDGSFANKMMHPRYHLPKTYHVTIDGVMSEYQVKQIRKGIMLEDGMTLPADALVLAASKNKNKTIMLITIFEGRNRQIKRMVEFFGYKVTRLERLTYGFLDKGRLHQGEFRKVRSYEIKKLLEYAEKGNQAIEMPTASNMEVSGSI